MTCSIPERNTHPRVLALMKNINDNALALMFKMVNEYNIINNAKNVNALIINNAIFLKSLSGTFGNNR